MFRNSTDLIFLSVLDYPIYVQVIIYSVLVGLLFLVGAFVYIFLKRRKKESPIREETSESEISDHSIEIDLLEMPQNYITPTLVEQEILPTESLESSVNYGRENIDGEVSSKASTINSSPNYQQMAPIYVNSKSTGSTTSKSSTSNKPIMEPMYPINPTIILDNESNEYRISERNSTHDSSITKSSSIFSSPAKQESPVDVSLNEDKSFSNDLKSQSSSYSRRIRSIFSKSSSSTRSIKGVKNSSSNTSIKEKMSNSNNEPVLFKISESEETNVSTSIEKESPIIPVLLDSEPIDISNALIPLTISSSTGLIKMNPDKSQHPDFSKPKKEEIKKINASNDDVIILKDEAQEPQSYIMETLLKKKNESTDIQKSPEKTETSEDISDLADNKFSKKLVSSLERIQKKKQSAKQEETKKTEEHSPKRIIDSQEIIKPKSDSQGRNSGVSHSSPLLSKIDSTNDAQIETDNRRIHSLTKITDDKGDDLHDDITTKLTGENELDDIHDSTESEKSYHETIPVVIKYFASWNKTGKVLNITIISVVGMNDLINYVGWKSLKIKMKEYPRKLYHYSTRWKPIERPFFNNNFTFYHMEEERLAESSIAINLYAKKNFGRGFLVASTMLELGEIDLTSVLCDDVKKISMTIDITEYKRY